MSELRGPIVKSLEQLATDLAVERYGDPHAGFVVFVYPDREPLIAILTDEGSRPLSVIKIPDKEGAEKPTSERDEHQLPGFRSDLADAATAFSDARFAVAMYGEKPGPVGQLVVEHMAESWQRHRDYDLQRHVEATEHARRYAAECPYCHSRFTLKGLPNHLRLAAWCSGQHQAVLAAQSSTIPTRP